MNKLKRDDEVIVITGRDKGKRGKIITMRDDGRVLVAGVNIVKKHTRPNPNVGEQGGIKEKEAPIQVSNLAIFNTATDKADRVGFKVQEDGKKVRIYKSTQEVIDA
ncbi:MAG: 50S ribosomal protein L24 [Pseudomonadales bacterium]